MRQKLVSRRMASWLMAALLSGGAITPVAAQSSATADQAAELGLCRRVDDDEATLSGLPDFHLFEPGHPGFDVMV